MKTTITLSLTLLCVLSLSVESLAQSKFKMELYGGPQYSYQKSRTISGNPLNSKVNLDYQLGVTFLFGVKSDLQLILQSEMTRPSFSFEFYPNSPNLTPSYQAKRIDDFGNYRLGLRKTWEQGKHAFFVQPSVGITINNYWDFPQTDSATFIFANKATKVVGNLGLEAGMKFYTKRKNYFLLGLRHQSGLGSLNSLEIGNYAGNSEALVERRGSYTGLFVGYGIDFKGRTKDEKLEQKLEKEEKRLEKRETAWGSGPYLMVNGLLRFRPKSEREPNLEFSHISGGYEFLGGYSFGSFSVESGYSKFNGFTNVNRPNGFNVQTNNNFSVAAIPLRFRYHKDLGDKNRLRLGTSLAAFYTLQTRGLNLFEIGSGGNSGDTSYSLAFNPTVQNSQGKVFFNAGVFAEIPIFNSSMMTFNFSRNFGSPEVGKVNVSGEIELRPVNFDASGTLNGWIMEVGYKLPLNIFFK